MDQRDTEIIQQVEEKSRLECQNSLLEERYERESTTWATDLQGFTKQVATLTGSLKSLQQERDGGDFVFGIDLKACVGSVKKN